MKTISKATIKICIYFFIGIYNMFTQNYRTLKLSILATIILIDVIMFRSGILYTHAMFCEIFFISALPIYLIMVGYLCEQKQSVHQVQKPVAKYPIINLDDNKVTSNYKVYDNDTNKYSNASALEETVIEREIKKGDNTIELIRETRKVVHLK